ncbi:hypothetical protein CPB83DRAFT_849026 [Crepidotus variabilis]|uniref:Uncharacterized protein n=1 Tax=Crepidotus variabilis TaxID=179855 RepID=A0A9P6JTC7_9AGAR|nr:hypothetical protein CPB83DRAFT_849026 [Crepidotus variabilis]
MVSFSIWLALGVPLVCGFVAATPFSLTSNRHRRGAASPTNSVILNSAQQYCLIVPKDPHTDIGDSEYPGGTTTYCSPAGHTSPDQGIIPDAFWTNVTYMSGTKEGRFAQLTGCINPSVLDRINGNDAGGQYDSSGGPTGTGNPVGSVCTGYNHYVELIEPAGPRACIRCCDDPADCPTHQDKTGCPNVIPGNYYNCGL